MKVVAIPPAVHRKGIDAAIHHLYAREALQTDEHSDGGPVYDKKLAQNYQKKEIKYNAKKKNARCQYYRHLEAKARSCVAYQAAGSGSCVFLTRSKGWEECHY